MILNGDDSEILKFLFQGIHYMVGSYDRFVCVVLKNAFSLMM
jgi:hypothetical protein